jgi:hypothetical protein
MWDLSSKILKLSLGVSRKVALGRGVAPKDPLMLEMMLVPRAMFAPN